MAKLQLQILVVFESEAWQKKYINSMGHVQISKKNWEFGYQYIFFEYYFFFKSKNRKIHVLIIFTFYLCITIYVSRAQLFKTRVAAVCVCTVEGYWLLHAELPLHPPLYIDAKEVVPPYAKGVERPTTPWRTTRPG